MVPSSVYCNVVLCPGPHCIWYLRNVEIVIINKITSEIFLLKVNGFEVYDTEEAILYFLEQDPEIVLSVARPIHKVTIDATLFVFCTEYS